MLSTPTTTEINPLVRAVAAPPSLSWDEDANRKASQSIAESLALLLHTIV